MRGLYRGGGAGEKTQGHPWFSPDFSKLDHRNAQRLHVPSVYVRLPAVSAMQHKPASLRYQPWAGVYEKGGLWLFAVFNISTFFIINVYNAAIHSIINTLYVQLNTWWFCLIASNHFLHKKKTWWDFGKDVETPVGLRWRVLIFGSFHKRSSSGDTFRQCAFAACFHVVVHPCLILLLVGGLQQILGKLRNAWFHSFFLQ